MFAKKVKNDKNKSNAFLPHAVRQEIAMAALAQSDHATGAPCADRATILVVGDPQTTQALVSPRLTEAGHAVLGADDVWQGCVLAEEHLPELILCDVDMPEMDGFALLARLRANPWLALTPIIMLARADDRAAVRQAMRLGAEDFLFKPVDPVPMLEAVHTQLERHRDRNTAMARLDGRQIKLLGCVLPSKFRNPLNIILGYGGLMGALAEEGLSSGLTAEISRELVLAGRQLLNQTHRFLTLSHLQGDHAVARQGRTRIDDAMVRATVDQVVALTGSRVPTPAQIAVEAATVACDGRHLHQALFELVANAMKFSVKGMPVAVCGRATADGVYTVAVENVGDPVPLECLDAVAAFRRTDPASSARQNAGVGLAIVSGVADLCHGHVEIENLPEGIVRVSLHLPVAAAEDGALRAVH
ncbi:response regulator [Nitrogeniibacter mangrovi]|uniref:Response regulator n=1 Tax=Nitrogeniibacter mangrovi TaxID=2016596 RepID=A0A6C1AZI3_9RHOO|nr:response regulator [Nitrogeniibacter mangrovi]QID16737.1 response regulator [Nitrogeniibacter mangrovi]